MTSSLSVAGILGLALILFAAPASPTQHAPAPRGAEPPDPNAPLVHEPAKDVPTLASLTLPLDQLKDARQEFDQRLSKPDSSAPAESVGTVVLSTKIDAGKFTFTDTADWRDDGKTYGIEMITAGAIGNELRPERLNVRYTTADPDTNVDVAANFTAASATVTSQGRQSELAVPAGSLTVDVLYRLVTLLPRRSGFAVSYAHYLDANAMVVNPGGTIACMSATEKLDVAGKQVNAFRFDVSSDGRVYLSMWVDEGGRLVQTCFEGTRWLVAKG
jgi:hypothetical protein